MSPRLEREAIADELLAQWFDEQSSAWLHRGKRRVSIDRVTGRVSVTVSLRDSGGRRCVLRVSRIMHCIRNA